ncbi:hypothetical protein BHE74_00048707 [Ensete ventricosum]|nr:hypothetical protein GW17_00045409 [Ensete ventricosum]RWW45463.1 hypothetical protein BHE74_00048707 [Ensete ventricosum]RZS12531.1 hypothetical protein BHM03_00044000 [Ensete ventricosum]
MPSFAGGRQVDGEIFPHRQVAPPVVGRRECLSGHSESTGGRNCCARIAVMPPPSRNLKIVQQTLLLRGPSEISVRDSKMQLGLRSSIDLMN